MNAGSAATTYYDVVTRYRVENLADGSLSRYSRGTQDADRATKSLRTSTAGLATGLRFAARALVPLTGGLGSVAAVGFAALKTFRNLNEQVNATLQMGAQINLSANFSPDPVENFNRSLVASKGLIRDLTSDAAKLPGELADFLDVARMISGATFGAGGDLKTIRSLTAKVALAAPAAGQSSRDAGNQAMRILYGTASVGDNPLFAMLRGAPGSGMRDTKTFNALPAAQRLKVFSDELAKLTDNPMFRKEIIRTFDTQLGTLADNLFGVQGIFGQLGKHAFDDFLQGLVDLNDWISQNKDEWVKNIGVLTGIGARPLGLSAQQLRNFMGSGDVPGRQSNLGVIDRLAKFQSDTARENAISERATRMMRMTMIGEGLPPETITALTASREFLSQPRYREMWPKMLEAAERQLNFAQKQAAEEDKEPKFAPKDLTKPKITQHFNIKLDLKSDDAPDAVAVRLTKAFEKAGRNPVTARRAYSAIGGQSALNP